MISILVPDDGLSSKRTRAAAAACEYSYHVCRINHWLNGYSPILTYEGQGCTKPGVHPSHHGIIYNSLRYPRPLPDEPELGALPVAIDLNRSESLRPESRVNYAKVTNIEHNVKVIFIGQVAMGHFGTVQEAFDRCWAQKISVPRSRR